MSDERFARQYRFRPPPEFLLASSCTSIVHHLSGPIMFALIRRNLGNAYKEGREAGLSVFLSLSLRPMGFYALRLADMLDSLVRVSRRVVDRLLAKHLGEGREDQSVAARVHVRTAGRQNASDATSTNPAFSHFRTIPL